MNEFTTLLEDLNSLMQQLKQLISGETGQQGPMEPTDQVMEAQKGTGTMEDENNIEKGLENTPSDGATANDDSNTRIEDPETPQGDQNVNEVTKGLLALLAQNNNIQKSVSKPDTEMSKVLSEIVKVTKSLTEKVNDQEMALKNILEGLGLADKVEKTLQPDNNQSVQKGLRNNQDFTDALNLIAKAMQQNQKNEVTYSTPREEARKTIQRPEVLYGLLKKN